MSQTLASLRASITTALSAAGQRLFALLRRDGLKMLAVALPLAIIFGPSLVKHMVAASDPLRFTDDARQQIYPFFKYYDSGLFPNDYPAAYYRACYPLGYQALYTIGGFFLDPALISKMLPYLLLAVTAVAAGVAAQRFAGYPGAFVAMFLVMNDVGVMDRVVGGLPRGFGFPLAALAVAGLVWGRARFLSALVCVGASFYPAGAMPAGLALALLLFVLPAADRGDASTWSLKKRFVVLSGTAVISAIILVPTLVASRGYGRTLTPADQAALPEIGPGGRYNVAADRSPFSSFPDEMLAEAKLMFRPAGNPLFPPADAWAKGRSPAYKGSHGQTLLEVLTAFLLCGAVVLSARNPAGRRLLIFGAAAWLGHFIARPLAPYFYLPQRYACYPVPMVLSVLLPASATALGGVLAEGRGLWLRRWLPLALVSLFVMVPFGGRGSATAGLTVDARGRKPLYDFLATLPQDSLIAGWPTDMDNIPYVSRRQVLLHYEVHQAFHERYVLELRRRMRAIIDAYYADNLGPLQYLRDEWKVTHFLFRPSYLLGGRPPNYFKPFDAWTKAAIEASRGRARELPRQVMGAQVFSDGTYIVLDLSKLKPHVAAQ